jgi:S-adenosylmethionine hydrolase
MAVIALLTDFGTSDVYAGVMKGVVLDRAPEARLIDLTHDVPPQGVLQGAFLLEAAVRFFPEGTIFLVVVDPGVGTNRRRLAIQAGGMTFVGPDNGCLSAALPAATRTVRSSNEAYDARLVRLEPDTRAVSIENEMFFLSPRSATFEGRDVFGPVAAFLANGGNMAELGSPVTDMLAFASFQAPLVDGRVRGRVIHADAFGNVITDIRGEDIALPPVRIEAKDRSFPLVRSYADAPAGEAIALVGSSGFLEVAVPGSNAAAVLGLAPGDDVVADVPG